MYWIAFLNGTDGLERCFQFGRYISQIWRETQIVLKILKQAMLFTGV